MVEKDSDKGRPLSPDENAEIRDLMERERRSIWIWSAIRIWAMWISAVIAAYYATKSFISDFFKGV